MKWTSVKSFHLLSHFTWANKTIRCLQLHLRLKSSESSPWLLRSPWQSGFTTSEMARRDICWSWWEMWHCEGWWPSLKRSSLYMSKSLRVLTKLEVSGFRCPVFWQTLLAAKLISCWFWGRRSGRDEESPRRKRCKSRWNGLHRIARAARIHSHHRGLHSLLPERLPVS